LEISSSACNQHHEGVSLNSLATGKLPIIALMLSDRQKSSKATEFFRITSIALISPLPPTSNQS
jgi:hypothetical protein